MKFYLIRHGETDYNLQRKYCGFSDPPLNEKGIWQAEKLSQRMKGIKIDKVFSSDLQRASETARIVFKEEPIIEFEKFREMNFGAFEGQTYEELLSKYKKLYTDWIDNPSIVRSPNGENLKEFYARVNEAFLYIKTYFKDESIAIVSHAGPIRAMLFGIMNFQKGSNNGHDLNSIMKIEQNNSALNIIEYSDKGFPNIICMNDTSHLS